MKIKIYPPLAIHELGNRDNQEDYIYPVYGSATTNDCLFIVCDGMGGHENGEVASQTFAVAIAEYFNAHADSNALSQDDVLHKAIAYAYERLDAKDDGNYKKMGTTLTLLYFHRGGVMAAHIGDSRIYHLRPGKNLLYISRDHSLVFDLYQSGEISYGEMKTSLQKNVITRAVQPGEENRVKPDVIHITDVKAGDYFFLCSDGMLEQMEDDDIFRLLSSRGSDDKKLRKLIEATAQNQDNHSAYMIHVESVTPDESDAAITGNEEQTARFNVLNMKPVKTHVSSTDVEDDDMTIKAPATPTYSRRGGKKKLSWLWWSMLIAAIVAAAAWLVLYGLEGKQGKEEPKTTAVEEYLGPQQEPIKPETHPQQQAKRKSKRAMTAAEAVKAMGEAKSAEANDEAQKNEGGNNQEQPTNEPGNPQPSTDNQNGN